MEYSLSVKERQFLEVVSGTDSCDNCGKMPIVLSIQRYSFGENCKEVKLCLPCETLKDKS